MIHIIIVHTQIHVQKHTTHCGRPHIKRVSIIYAYVKVEHKVVIIPLWAVHVKVAYINQQVSVQDDHSCMTAKSA